MFIYVVLFIILILLPSMFRVIREYERAVVFRLGRIIPVKGPGLIFLFPVLDKMERVSLRLLSIDVPEQDVITRDNVSVRVNAVVYLRVVDPIKAIIEVKNYVYTTQQLAQTTLRSVLGQVELDELLSKRDKINDELQTILDQLSDPWGVKVTAVEIKHVDLPQEMQRAMARQAEAERIRRAKIINALGEQQAAEKLSQASEMLTKSPMSLQLRYLQTLNDIASENNSTIVFPIPLDLIKPFLKKEK